ncbi:NAD-dependent epimerase/dehydratase [Candidatus Omnitrophus magneticus]|uniref:NAD-dependent epimerase/dehydratase n=1 Tax=Candidatus Omnitrophus magneticus TaxID=1609969 RepID=A0A0F0CRH0_9BACT|nr:NAD-dependent epimerase/dehydratase [Candidatus Omnitrophus magneticus]
MENKPKVLITGATGFIGGKFTKRIYSKGYDISITIRQNSNLKELERLPIKKIECDITDKLLLDEFFAQEKFDYVVHCAAIVKTKNAALMKMVNIEGTRNIADVSLKYKIKRFIYLSSIATIAGNTGELKENMPYKATNLYGETKIEAEKIVLDYRKKGLSCAILRPCMIYGEGEPHALDKIFTLIKRGFIFVPGMKNPHDKLQLGYVENVVDAMEIAMIKESALAGTFITADKEVITIRKFIEIAKQELGANKIFIIPEWLVQLGLMFPPFKKKFNKIFKNRTYDISPLTNILGYIPRISTEEGLCRTIRHWINQKNTIRHDK